MFCGQKRALKGDPNVPDGELEKGNTVFSDAQPTGNRQQSQLAVREISTRCMENIFARRVTNHWNSLLKVVVASSCLDLSNLY